MNWFASPSHGCAIPISQSRSKPSLVLTAVSLGLKLKSSTMENRFANSLELTLIHDGNQFLLNVNASWRWI